jgi:HMG box factor
LYAAGIEEENGLGTNQDPGWENVGDACVESDGIQVMMSKDKSKSKAKKPCEHPDKYLFW